VLLVFATLILGCTRADTVGPSLSPVSSPSTSPSSAEVRDRLFALANEWFSTSATVAYRTTGPVPGQPTTAHLCLRQMSDRDFGVDRTKLLRKCSRQGSLRLMWDPPDRWRMDAVTPVDRFTLLSTRERTRICRGQDRPACRVIPTAEGVAMASADVFLRPPARILDQIGATEVTAIASPDDAVVPVECFAASGPVEHVEWCFGADGVLISFLRGSGGAGWASIEATDVS
jgi:hypothetical protein